MPVEHRIVTTASPETVYRIYEDVARWHTWDPDTKQASLDGPFQAGSRGRLVPTRGRPVPMLLTQVAPGKGFTAESSIPLFRMKFEHELRPSAGQTEIVHRVTFSGPLSFLLAPLLKRQLDAGLPVTLVRLKALAETRSAEHERAPR